MKNNEVNNSTCVENCVKEFKKIENTHTTLVYEGTSNQFFQTFYSDSSKYPLSELYTVLGCKNIKETKWENNRKTITMDYKTRGVPFIDFTLCIRDFILKKEKYTYNQR